MKKLAKVKKFKEFCYLDGSLLKLDREFVDHYSTKNGKPVIGRTYSCPKATPRDDTEHNRVTVFKHPNSKKWSYL